MIWAALLIAVQAPPSWQEDVLAGEVLDYRGRRDACEYTAHEAFEWRMWHCNELERNRATLRAKLNSRPDLLSKLDAPFDPKDKLLIVSADERHSAKLQRIVQEGTIQDGSRVSVAVQAKADRLDDISVERFGRQPIVISFDDPIEYPDLRSMWVLWYRSAIQVELKFGAPHPWCFSTQDGTSKLTVTIEGNKASAVRLDTVNCTLASRPVAVSIR